MCAIISIDIYTMTVQMYMTFVKLQSLELLKLKNKCSYKTKIMFSCTSHQTHVHHIDLFNAYKGPDLCYNSSIDIL